MFSFLFPSLQKCISCHTLSDDVELSGGSSCSYTCICPIVVDIGYSKCISITVVRYIVGCTISIKKSSCCPYIRIYLICSQVSVTVKDYHTVICPCPDVCGRYQ